MSTTPDDSQSIESPFDKAMTELEEWANYLVVNKPKRRWMPAMRNKADDLGVGPDVQNDNLQSALDKAEASLDPVRVYRKGDRLQAKESTFLVDGLVKLGETNMIVGQPKVGKSSFTTGLIAALRDKKDEFLGCKINHPPEPMPVLIFGTDQSEGDWLHFLTREGLAGPEQDLRDVDFFISMESGHEFNFTHEGRVAMQAKIEEYESPLVVIDSLSSMMEPLGLEENSTRYAAPIRMAMSQLRKTGATLLIVHHSVKRPTTWDWVTESRGSSSITGLVSWGVLMRWVNQEDDSTARTDKRVGFTGKGRGSGESSGVMAEYRKEGGWVFLEGLEAAQQAERAIQKMATLNGVRAQVYDVLVQRHEQNIDISPDELASELNKGRSAMNRELRILKSMGIAVVAREQPSPGGGRPMRFWELSESAKAACVDSPWEGQKGGFCGSLVLTQSQSSNKNKKTLKQTLRNDIPVLETDQREVSEDQQRNTASSVKETPKIRTLVERFVNGKWTGRWVISEVFSDDRITIQKFGQPAVSHKNQRWGMDIRPLTPVNEETAVDPAACARSAAPSQETANSPLDQFDLDF